MNTPPSKNGLTLTINPPKLLSFISAEEQDNSLALLDLSVDKLKTNLHFDISAVFTDIGIKRRGIFRQRSYTIGTTDIEIIFEVSDGQIIKCTENSSFEVNYSVSSKKKRNIGLSVNPTITGKAANQEVECKIGGLTLEAGKESEYVTGFKGTENDLVVIKYRQKRLKWRLKLPRVQRTTYDCLIGNLYLFAECDNDKKYNIKGTISIEPKDCLYLNSEGEILSEAKGAGLKFFMWTHRIKVYSDKVEVFFGVQS